jgi:hypothetical protein
MLACGAISPTLISELSYFLAAFDGTRVLTDDPEIIIE